MRARRPASASRPTARRGRSPRARAIATRTTASPRASANDLPGDDQTVDRALVEAHRDRPEDRQPDEDVDVRDHAADRRRQHEAAGDPLGETSQPELQVDAIAQAQGAEEDPVEVEVRDEREADRL